MCEQLVTVFTPTYNRLHTLGRTYDSLKKQTNKGFVWLIIDDGSTDGTNKIVKNWCEEADFEIRYIYKENGGMHTAHNIAYANINTELNICIDSDDELAIDAIDIIYTEWKKISSDEIAGLIALDSDMNGNILGKHLPVGVESLTLSDYYYKYRGSGDKKLVYRTDIIKSVQSYPEFKNERLVPLSYKYLIVDQTYNLKCVDKVLCNVEYQVDGSSNTIVGQYFKSPNGFSEFRKLEMKIHPSMKRKFISIVHYIALAIIKRNGNYIVESPKPFWTLLLSPLGLVMYWIYLRKQ